MTGKTFASTEDAAEKKISFDQIGSGFTHGPPRTTPIPASSSAMML